MLGWAEAITVWLLELPAGAKAWMLVAMGVHMIPLLAGTALAASMHTWMAPFDADTPRWRKLPVEPFREVLLASRRRALTVSLAMLAWSLPLLGAVAVEHAAWTAPEAIAAYERSAEAGQTFADAHRREGERNDGSWASRGRIYPWTALGFVLAMAITFQGFLWLGYARHAASVQAELAKGERGV